MVLAIDSQGVRPRSVHTSSSLRLEPLVVEAEAGAGFVPSSVLGCEETYCLDTAEYPARDSLNTILDSDGGSALSRGWRVYDAPLWQVTASCCGSCTTTPRTRAPPACPPGHPPWRSSPRRPRPPSSREHDVIMTLT